MEAGEREKEMGVTPTPKRELRQAECRRCAKPFRTRIWNQVYCTTQCAKAAENARRYARRKGRA